MHCKGDMCCMVWVDKKSILLLSTYVYSLSPDLEYPIIVPRFSNGKTTNVPTSPIHLEYIQKMRGVDVNDQLRASYTTLTRSKKWWHHIFIFLLDVAITNS